MTLSDLRTQFLALLNRSDCSNDQGTIFLVQGMQRIERAVRLPSMERLQLFTSTTDLTNLPLPNDLLQIIDVFVPASCAYAQDVADDASAPLDMLTYRALQSIPLSCPPRAYARFQASLMIRGAVPTGNTVQLYYYGEFSPFASDTDENEISASSPDLCCYAALSLAGDYYNHPKADAWEARYAQYLSEVAQLATDVDSMGGPSVVMPTHES